MESKVTHATTPTTEATSHFPSNVQPHQIVIMMADNRWHPPTDYLKLSCAINRAYAEHHGHRFVACDTADFPDVPANLPHVGKLFCSLRALRSSQDDVRMLVYLDSDAIMRNFSKTFTEFIQENMNATKYPPSSYDIIVPTDCSGYQFNTGLQIWRNSPSAHEFLRTWINRTLSSKRYTKFAFEQKAFKDMYNEPGSVTTPRVATIEKGQNTWHLGACAKSSGYRRAPSFIAHIPGKWKEDRLRFMSDFIRDLCIHKESQWHVHVAACDTLMALI